MKRYLIIDDQGKMTGCDIRASKHSEARYKLVNSFFWKTAKTVREIGLTSVKDYSVSEVYRKW